MSQEHVFEFSGSKETFLNNLDRLARKNTYSDGTYYYFDDYIVELIDDEIHFGVARAGHSGGYWFVPTITDLGNKIEFRGKIQYIGPEYDNNRSLIKKAIDSVSEFLLFILMLPIVLIVWIYMFFEWLVRKIIRRPKPKEKTNEEKLFDLMENYLHCVRK